MLYCKTHTDDPCWQAECRMLDYPQYAQAWANQQTQQMPWWIIQELIEYTEHELTEVQLTAWSELERFGVVYWNMEARDWLKTPALY